MGRSAGGQRAAPGRGSVALASRIEAAPGYLGWLIDEVRPGEPRLSPEQKKDRIRSILEILSAIPDRILRYEEYRRVSEEVGVPVEILWAAEPGNRGYTVRRVSATPPRYAVIERYRDRAAFEAHRAEPHVTAASR